MRTDGNRYVGEFRDGKYHGQGTYTFADGHKYVGEFRDGLHHGQGTYTFPDGHKYVGEFRGDKFHGRGILTFNDGRSPLEGIWERHKFVSAERIPPGIAGKPTPSELLSPARKKCRELGVSPGTEKFGDCVLRLSK